MTEEFVGRPAAKHALHGERSDPAGGVGRLRRVFKISLPPDLATVRQARELMREVAGFAGLDDSRLFNLQVVVSEACTNAIEHAGTGVDVVAWVLQDRIVVEIESDAAFQTKLFSEETSQRGGLGIPLMASLADQVQVSRLAENLTRVAVTFLLQQDVAAEWESLGSSTSREPDRAKLLDDPRVHGVVLTPEQARARRQFEHRLSRQALEDPLTQLANRAALFDRGEKAVSRISPDRGSVALLLLDVDDFKHVNDTLGHAAGDELLATVGVRLQSLLRAGDTAARLGGDEFVVLLERYMGPLEPMKVAERVLDRLREPYGISSGELCATFSMGISKLDADVTSFADLLRRADLALYATKARGKNGWSLFDPAMMDAERVRRVSESDLQAALRAERIITYFQPIVSAHEGAVVGVEALVRWSRPDRDILLPGSFIDLAEESGLIVPIGYEVLEQSCRRLHEWDVTLPERRLQLMVNLSARQLRERDLVAHVGAALAAGGLAPERLALEIDEDVFAGDSLSVRENVTALRAGGVHIALDGFGSGSSSLRALSDYPIDILKLAKSFIQDAADKEESALLLAAVCGLAKSSGTQVVVEGVETRQELDMLLSLGCDRWQGNYFSLPVPPSEIPVVIASEPPAGSPV
ncbi:MAG: EAL domain-containing protein [Actinobacteria bacterium]|nr:EAL domain-containing protein [Actinomycetota bacterium]